VVRLWTIPNRAQSHAVRRRGVDAQYGTGDVADVAARLRCDCEATDEGFVRRSTETGLASKVGRVRIEGCRKNYPSDVYIIASRAVSGRVS
jgi:hypothetical protein